MYQSGTLEFAVPHLSRYLLTLVQISLAMLYIPVTSSGAKFSPSPYACSGPTYWALSLPRALEDSTPMSLSYGRYPSILYVLVVLNEYPRKLYDLLAAVQRHSSPSARAAVFFASLAFVASQISVTVSHLQIICAFRC